MRLIVVSVLILLSLRVCVCRGTPFHWTKRCPIDLIIGLDDRQPARAKWKRKSEELYYRYIAFSFDSRASWSHMARTGFMTHPRAGVNTTSSFCPIQNKMKRDRIHRHGVTNHHDCFRITFHGRHVRDMNIVLHRIIYTMMALVEARRVFFCIQRQMCLDKGCLHPNHVLSLYRIYHIVCRGPQHIVFQ